MKRGWILVFSVLLEVAAILGLLFLFPVTIIGGIAASPLVFLVLPFVLIYFWWAPNNLFFTFVPEGRAKIVVRGDKFEKALIQWENHTYDGNWNIIPVGVWTKDGKVLEKKEGRLIEKISEVMKKTRTINGEKKQIIVLEEREKEVREEEAVPPRPEEKKRRLGGLRFYGLWPILDIYIYDFSWTGVAQDGQIQPHAKERLDYILVKVDVYWARVQKAEDMNMLPLDVELVLTTRVINPYRALFRVQNWLETVINRIEPAVRDAITQDTYERWISEEKDLGDRLILDRETQELLKELRSGFGVEVIAIEVRSINPTTAELDEPRRATLKRYFAEKERDRITIEADAERQRLEAVYKAVQQFGDLGKLIRTLEAAEKSPLAASLTVQAIPGLQEVLRGVFGKPPETVFPEEIKRLREEIERLRGERGK